MKLALSLLFAALFSTSSFAGFSSLSVSISSTGENAKLEIVASSDYTGIADLMALAQESGKKVKKNRYQLADITLEKTKKGLNKLTIKGVGEIYRGTKPQAADHAPVILTGGVAKDLEFALMNANSAVSAIEGKVTVATSSYEVVCVSDSNVYLQPATCTINLVSANQ